MLSEKLKGGFSLSPSMERYPSGCEKMKIKKVDVRLLKIELESTRNIMRKIIMHHQCGNDCASCEMKEMCEYIIRCP